MRWPNVSVRFAFRLLHCQLWRSNYTVQKANFGGNGQSIGLTVSDAIVRSWLRLTATRSCPLRYFNSIKCLMGFHGIPSQAYVCMWALADHDVNIPFRLSTYWSATEYIYARSDHIPLLKCKSKDPADVNNYRPIAIATPLSNVLEQVLLSLLARYLWTADSLFGFKQAHGTEMAILHSSKQ